MTRCPKRLVVELTSVNATSSMGCRSTRRRSRAPGPQAGEADGLHEMALARTGRPEQVAEPRLPDLRAKMVAV